MSDGRGAIPPAGGGGENGPPPGGPPQPPTPPSAAGGQPPLNRPTGISPATQGAGQMGMEMQARVAVSFLANQLAMWAARLGVGSELGRALHQSAGVLSKAVPPGSIPPGAEQALMERMQLAQRQGMANQSALQQMRQGGPQAGVSPPGAPRPPGGQMSQMPVGTGMGAMSGG